ncbi:MAG TPA: hypothetical protein VN030_13185 [Cellvibrio sp.]|nr:hypothetical protein [Cellvibrio sp.]
MNTIPSFPAIADLVLHSASMLLVESVVHWDETGIDVIVNPADSYLFFDAKGEVPSWVGIEYMAQAISAYAGREAVLSGEPLRIGFLLGTRKYTALVPSFPLQQKLSVKVRELLRDETNLVLFDCAIYSDDVLVAQAEIKAIQPNNASAIIN